MSEDSLKILGGPAAVSGMASRVGAVGASFQDQTANGKSTVDQLMNDPLTFGNDKLGQQGKQPFLGYEEVFENREHLGEQLNTIATNAKSAIAAYGDVDEFFENQHRNVQA
ncbi:hypothetical protein MOQ72_27565 [Saccharopolyspora sp. K220]|uniref:hypothetical protein n=1 Tax=Saccharopolyspora soli TaxID=2926618 RepID=UPI001F58C68D|nr:hypothetical protein [Saccharopolyspora soli]MCI2421206.1 hypothetical protein [Saccharopolyspora soli]